MAEATVCHVGFHLSENSLGFDASPSSVPDAIFRGEQFAGFALVPVEPVVDLDYPSVAPCLVAQAPQRTAVAVPCAVACRFASVAAGGFGVRGSDARHMLPHRTDTVVLVGIVEEVFGSERIRLVVRTLLKVEAVVLDVGVNPGFVHEAVVLFGAVAGVGDHRPRHTPVTVLERVEERDEREGVGRIGEQGEVGDELVFGRDLQVVARLGLAVVHCVLLHAHERGVGVGLRH